MKGYLYLTASIMAEVLSTTMLKFSDGFTRFFPSCGAILGYLLTFYSLSLCLNFIPLSIAYAVWSGVGTALTVLIGIMIWGEVLNINQNNRNHFYCRRGDNLKFLRKCPGLKEKEPSDIDDLHRTAGPLIVALSSVLCQG